MTDPKQKPEPEGYDPLTSFTKKHKLKGDLIDLAFDMLGEGCKGVWRFCKRSTHRKKPK